MEANNNHRCECNLIVSWYQKRCERPAKYKVTHKTLYLNDNHSIWSRLECAACSRRQREHRYKLDNHLYYNDATLDHTYPIIEAIK